MTTSTFTENRSTLALVENPWQRTPLITMGEDAKSMGQAAGKAAGWLLNTQGSRERKAAAANQKYQALLRQHAGNPEAQASLARQFKPGVDKAVNNITGGAWSRTKAVGGALRSLAGGVKNFVSGAANPNGDAQAPEGQAPAAAAPAPETGFRGRSMGDLKSIARGVRSGSTPERNHVPGGRPEASTPPVADTVSNLKLSRAAQTAQAAGPSKAVQQRLFPNEPHLAGPQPASAQQASPATLGAVTGQAVNKLKSLRAPGAQAPLPGATPPVPARPAPTVTNVQSAPAQKISSGAPPMPSVTSGSNNAGVMPAYKVPATPPASKPTLTNVTQQPAAPAVTNAKQGPSPRQQWNIDREKLRVNMGNKLGLTPEQQAKASAQARANAPK